MTSAWFVVEGTLGIIGALSVSKFLGASHGYSVRRHP
jgi:hypothetical protein